jgi:hypothetical protein
MTLDDVLGKLHKFAETHDYDEDFDEFDSLCDNIMSDKQTYFQWEIDGDCFDISDAFDTVLDCIKEAQKKGQVIKDYCPDFLFDDDRLFLFVEYK